MARLSSSKGLVALTALLAGAALVLLAVSKAPDEHAGPGAAVAAPTAPGPTGAVAKAPATPDANPVGARLPREVDATSRQLQDASKGAPFENGKTAEALERESREALARSIERRRAAALKVETDPVERERILKAISRNREKLGVTVAVDELLSLLTSEYKAATEADHCQLSRERPPECARIEEALAQVRRTFNERTGFTVEEFRQGQRSTPRDAFSSPPQGG